MATSPAKRKSAIDELLNDFQGVIEQGASKMTAQEIERATEDVKNIIRRPSAKPARRETAWIFPSN